MSSSKSGSKTDPRHRQQGNSRSEFPFRKDHHHAQTRTPPRLKKLRLRNRLHSPPSLPPLRRRQLKLEDDPRRSAHLPRLVRCPPPKRQTVQPRDLATLPLPMRPMRHAPNSGTRPRKNARRIIKTQTAQHAPAQNVTIRCGIVSTSPNRATARRSGHRGRLLLPRPHGWPTTAPK